MKAPDLIPLDPRNRSHRIDWAAIIIMAIGITVAVAALWIRG